MYVHHRTKLVEKKISDPNIKYICCIEQIKSNPLSEANNVPGLCPWCWNLHCINIGCPVEIFWYLTKKQLDFGSSSLLSPYCDWCLLLVVSGFVPKWDICPHSFLFSVTALKRKPFNNRASSASAYRLCASHVLCLISSIVPVQKLLAGLRRRSGKFEKRARRQNKKNCCGSTRDFTCCGK